MLQPKPDSRIYYGWYVAAVGFIANFMAVGTQFYLFNAFMEPLGRLRGWSRMEINGAMFTGALFGLVGQFVFGTLAMRIGPRRLMLVGSAASGVIFIILGRVTDLWLFYLLCILLNFFNMAYGGIVANTVVSNWFVRKRGTALGFSTSGISASGVVLPLAAMLIVMKTDLSQAYLLVGLMTLVVGPIAFLVVRDWPEPYGLEPDGARRPTADTGSVSTIVPMVFWPLSGLIRTGAFWKLGTAYSLVLACMVGVMSQLKPRFTDVGLDDMTAMLFMAATALFGVFGKFLWGRLCDRFNSRRVAAVMMMNLVLGLALALVRGSLWSLIAFVPVFGLGMGGVAATYPVLAADLFGRLSFPSVFRYLSLFAGIQVSGYMIAGLSYDRFGSYDPAYILFMVMAALAAWLVFSIRRPVQGR